MITVVGALILIVPDFLIQPPVGAEWNQVVVNTTFQTAYVAILLGAVALSFRLSNICDLTILRRRRIGGVMGVCPLPAHRGSVTSGVPTTYGGSSWPIIDPVSRHSRMAITAFRRRFVDDRREVSAGQLCRW